jgi:hypothetical protein
MIRLVQVAPFLIASVLAYASFAQSEAAASTAVPVLNAAKDLAGTESAGGLRRLLRERVVRSIRNVGQEAAFHTYVADVSPGWIPAYIQNDPDWQENRKLEAEAQRLFLAGDEKGAKQQLRKCRFIPHFDFCMTQDYFLQFKFLNWELEAQDLSAALRRFRATDWKGMADATGLRLVRAYIVAGRQSEVADLLLEMNEEFRAAVEQGRLGDGAVVRNLINTGDTDAAMRMVLSRPSISERVAGLTIIAEGLANLPGPPDESLKLL